MTSAILRDAGRYGIRVAIAAPDITPGGPTAMPAPATPAFAPAPGRLRTVPGRLLALLLGLGAPAAGRSEPPNVFEAVEDRPVATDAADELPEPGLFFPGDRTRERELDRARRLVADARWSDAAVVLDELLAGEQDAFVVAGSGTTRGSIRSAAATAVAELPRPGRDAYRRLFDGRAAKQLATAIAADDQAGIVAVARRWLHTAAGRQAALLAGLSLLESGQHLAAAAWLDRLAELEGAREYEPTLSVMRAIARSRTGDEQAAERLLPSAGRRGPSGVRLAGRDLTIPAAADVADRWLAETAGSPTVTEGDRRAGPDWRQFGGGPARGGVTTASRPLLVPRYRVPLVRHPDEGRRLEQARVAAADAGEPLLPAGTPLAIGDRLVVQTPLGILAIEFESGRRVWLEAAVSASDAEPDVAAGWALEAEAAAAQHRAFDDATSGNLASDGRLVFAVESPAAALVQARVSPDGFGFGGRAGGGQPQLANTLSAYALADGAVRWRLPAAGGRTGRDGDAAQRWHLGPPLVVGDDLFVLVEERGEVRVEARAAADGLLRWAQPLATYEDGQAIDEATSRPRRLAGLTPAFAEGILVCPIGAGGVVAVDVATRSLLWAHAYPQGDGLEADPSRRRQEGEPAPVIAGGRVLLAPYDSDMLICLGLTDGQPAWRQRRGPGTRLIGAVDAKAITVGDAAVEAVDLATGRPLWKRDLGEGVRPSGRGLLTPKSVLVPCDAPAVVEVAVADGRIIGRSAGRGGRIPGNLVAHRGELISRTADSLDVFHQKAVLEERIETARKAGAPSPWATYWLGQAAIDAGDVTAGLEAVAAAAATPGFRMPPDDLDDAIVAAMRCDFPAAARAWKKFPDRVDETGPRAGARVPVARMAVDGFLAQGDTANAWTHLAPLLASWPTANEPEETFADDADQALEITADRWLRGRLMRVASAADESLRGEVDQACAALVRDAAQTPEKTLRQRRLEVAGERLGGHPAAAGAWAELAAAGGGRQADVRAALARHAGHHQAAPDTGRDDPSGDDDGWPLGQVDVRLPRGHGPARTVGRRQLLPVPLAGGGTAGTRAAQAVVDLERQRLVIADAYGRPVTDPLPVEGLGMGLGIPFFNQTLPLELAVVGRALVVRTPAGIVAYDLDAPPGTGRGLWRKPDFGIAVDDRMRWGGGRAARDGGVPLGLRIIEPDDRPRGSGRGLVATPAGVFVPGPTSIAMLDPATGRLLWERHRLPPGLEWFIDAEFLCGATADGRGTVVCQTTDGRLLHTTDVPHRRQRVASKGRRFVAVRPLDEHPTGPVADRVRLELVDPVDRESRPIGEFAGDARATATGDGRLAVLEPGGRLAVFELADGSLVFRAALGDAPRRIERLHVVASDDRYLVFAGASDDDPGVEINPPEQFIHAGGAAAPLSGAVWAVAAADGRPLWPVPALIERHCLHPSQPPGLPILTFCRMLSRREVGNAVLGVLCLDKRTGHAVFESDRVAVASPQAFGCDLAGDPAVATVRLGDERPLELVFTGRPLAPQPPFRGRGRPPGLGDDEILKER